MQLAWFWMLLVSLGSGRLFSLLNFVIKLLFAQMQHFCCCFKLKQSADQWRAFCVIQASLWIHQLLEVMRFFNARLYWETENEPQMTGPKCAFRQWVDAVVTSIVFTVNTTSAVWIYDGWAFSSCCYGSLCHHGNHRNSKEKCRKQFCRY